MSDECCTLTSPSENELGLCPLSRKGIVSEKLICDFDHQRRVPAVVKLEVKSTRATKPGHPMIRVVAICAAHARELRRLGLELVAGG
jgi:hypothetical protein